MRAWPVVMSAVSLAVAAHYLGELLDSAIQGWQNHFAYPSAAMQVLSIARYGPDLLLMLGVALLMLRRRAGVFIHVIYALAALAVLGIFVALDVLAYRSPKAVWQGWGYLLMEHLQDLIHGVYPLCVLAWLARPGIIRQVAHWNRPAEPPDGIGPRAESLGPAWPAAIGGGSIALGALTVAATIVGWVQVMFDSPWSSPIMELKAYWFFELGRLTWPEFLRHLAPGALGAGLIFAGIGLARRWPAAAIAHVAAVIVLPACVLSLWLVVAGTFVPRHCWEIVTPLLTDPLFILYPPFLLAWFARKSIRREVFAWRTEIRRRDLHRGPLGRWTFHATRLAIVSASLLLPAAAFTWGCWPKTPARRGILRAGGVSAQSPQRDPPSLG